MTICHVHLALALVRCCSEENSTFIHLSVVQRFTDKAMYMYIKYWVRGEICLCACVIFKDSACPTELSQ